MAEAVALPPPLPPWDFFFGLPLLELEHPPPLLLLLLLLFPLPLPLPPLDEKPVSASTTKASTAANLIRRPATMA
ncbi:hypothetical protein GCM10020254_48740 [Streptomyces goshikiensis]